MFNPHDSKDIMRLQDAVQWSRQNLSRFRRMYRELIEEFVTEKYHSDADLDGTNKEVIVNLLNQAVDIHVMHLAPSNPRATVSTDFREYKTVAYDFELALEKEFKRMKVGKVLKEITMDAWFSAGFLKMFLAEGNPVDINGEMIDIGELRVASVSIDNWVHDCSARKFDECDFYGDKQRVRMSALKASKHYDNLDQLSLKIDEYSSTSSVDEFGGDGAATLSVDQASDTDSTMSDYVEIWDLFLPREQLLLTIPAQPYGASLPLRVIEWKGPKHGPYRMLQLSEVPENIMPSSPGMQLAGLHDFVNNLYRKLKKQAKRQKEVTMVKPGGEEDAEKIREAADGEMIGVNDPSNVTSIRYGGVDAQNHGFAVHLMGLFDQQAGNLQMLGGLGTSADTLGQEAILQQQSSIRIEKQKAIVLELVQGIAEDIAWYRWNDVFFDPNIVKKVPGTNVQVAGSFKPADRIGRFIDYNFTIDPYSMEYMPPGARLAIFKSTLVEMVMPMYPLMEQQGITLDMEQILKTIARLSNVPELLEAITFSNGEAHSSPEGKSIQSVNRPAVTRRENVRINQSNGSGDQEKMAQRLIGSGGQPGQMSNNR